MSREEAHHRTTGNGRTGAGRAAAPASAEAAPPQPPLFSARTDETAAVVRTRGHLDGVGADVLCRVVTGLRELGHRQIDVRLGTATVVDEDALSLLTDHARRLRDDGVRLQID